MTETAWKFVLYTAVNFSIQIHKRKDCATVYIDHIGQALFRPISLAMKNTDVSLSPLLK
jgi:hypothetical protein